MAPACNTRRRRRVKSISTIPKSKPRTTAAAAKKSTTAKRRLNSTRRTKMEREAAHLAPATSSASSGSSSGSEHIIDGGFEESSIIINGGFHSKNIDVVGNESSSICSTPKGQRFRIPKIDSCPPAPRKKQRDGGDDALFSTSQRSNCSSLQRRPIAFFAPPDLELFFFFARRHISV